MKRTIIAVLLAGLAGASFASLPTIEVNEQENTEYNNVPGKEDLHRNQVGDASRFDAGQQDEHQPQVG